MLENTLPYVTPEVEKIVALKVIQGEALGLSLIEQTELLTRSQETLERIRTEKLASFISVDVVFQHGINLFNAENNGKKKMENFKASFSKIKSKCIAPYAIHLIQVSPGDWPKLIGAKYFQTAVSDFCGESTPGADSTKETEQIDTSSGNVMPTYF